MAPGKRSTWTSRKPEEPVPTDYEKIRAMNMMKNNQLFQRLGLGQLKSLVTATATNNKEDCPQQSESLYDGENTDNSNEEESQCRNDGRANISNDGDQISTKVTRGNKRIVAPVQERTIRVTRQRIAEINQENSHNLSVHKQLSSCPATNHDSIETLVVPTQPSANTTIDNNPTHNIDNAIEPNSLIQEESDNHNAVEGTIDIIPRRKSMGKQLESLSRGLGMKIPIQITEGSKRPEPPIQAAKFASEGGITLRQHIPIFHHWKEYKRKENEPTIKNYIGKVNAQFTMDNDSKAVEDACLDMLKGKQPNAKM
ncbi:uncharacterized protein [Zea mays]|uniref:uncharacterized protein n=1 Tax=Zea mays TaxID=4577 RepID=UPI0009A95E10|nr:uncharacterized protein LOC103644717 [Zea mays]|eukprot:XP_020397425.1 uncharacterized protein LOC103644717 [Zea mays]